MNTESRVEFINCPLCDASTSRQWANENGFKAVKCLVCGLVYVNPRPSQELITEAIKTGVHSNVAHDRTAIGRRVHSKVAHYSKIINRMFSDVWEQHQSISWLDIGAGYGEVLEAISTLAPKGSKIEGIEPMKPKADHARVRGLNIREAYLSELNETYDFISLINVFSHIPDFRLFLKDIKRILIANGELFIETGNIGDLTSSSQVPSELDLPDHLVFAGEQNIADYLSESGFTIIKIEKQRKDGLTAFAKNIVKIVLGRPANLVMPYTSPYRTILIRAKYNAL